MKAHFCLENWMIIWGFISYLIWCIMCKLFMITWFRDILIRFWNHIFFTIQKRRLKVKPRWRWIWIIFTGNFLHAYLYITILRAIYWRITLSFLTWTNCAQFHFCLIFSRFLLFHEILISLDLSLLFLNFFHI